MPRPLRPLWLQRREDSWHERVVPSDAASRRRPRASRRRVCDFSACWKWCFARSGDWKRRTTTARRMSCLRPRSCCIMRAFTYIADTCIAGTCVVVPTSQSPASMAPTSLTPASLAPTSLAPTSQSPASRTPTSSSRLSLGRDELGGAGSCLERGAVGALAVSVGREAPAGLDARRGPLGHDGADKLHGA